MDDCHAIGNGEPRRTVIGTVTREYEVPLTLGEQQRLYKELAATFREKRTEETEQTEQKARMRERLAAIETKQQKLADVLERGTGPCAVEVRIEADYESGLAYEVRSDTNQVVLTRPLLEGERQLQLQPDVAAKAADAMVEHSL
jgi:hypothetical protein